MRWILLNVAVVLLPIALLGLFGVHLVRTVTALGRSVEATGIRVIRAAEVLQTALAEATDPPSSGVGRDLQHPPAAHRSPSRHR